MSTEYPFLRPDPPKLSQLGEALAKIEQSGIFSNFGPTNQELESVLIEQLFGGVGHCVTTCNATLGLILAIRHAVERRFGAAGRGRRKYALMPSFTFAATGHAALWTLSWEILLYALLFIVGLGGMLSPSGMTAVYGAGLVLFGAFLGNTSETFLVVVPFFLLFCGGAFIRMREGDFDIRFMGVFSLAVLLALNVPAAPQALNAAYDYVPFLYGPGIGSGGLWLFLHVLTLPFAIIMIARYCPVSLPLKHDYSYGVYVFAWPAQQLTIFYLIKWALPVHPLAVFALSGAATFVLAALLWHLIERPAMRLKGGRRQGAGARHWSEIPKPDSV